MSFTRQFDSHLASESPDAQLSNLLDLTFEAAQRGAAALLAQLELQGTQDLDAGNALRCAETVMREPLLSRHPEAGLLSPLSAVRPAARSRWLIEPLTDPATFAKRRSTFAFSIALEIDGAPRLALIHAPALSKTWWAAAGIGAYTGPGLDHRTAPWKRLGVGPARSLRDAFVCWPEHPIGVREIDDRLDALLEIVRGQNQAPGFWGVMRLAEGRADVAISTSVSIHLLVAYRSILEQAGGSLMWGDLPSDPERMMVVAANESLAGALSNWMSVV